MKWHNFSFVLNLPLPPIGLTLTLLERKEKKKKKSKRNLETYWFLCSVPLVFLSSLFYCFLMEFLGEWSCPEFAFLMASMARNLIILIDFSSNPSQSCHGSPRQTHGDWVLMPSVAEFFRAATTIHLMTSMGSRRLEAANSPKATTAAVLMIIGLLKTNRNGQIEI
ncbi:hypothetical protein NE237_002894 [Protea cynaroides]|uniref:Uncharacterized protein n=1 Tax=Protea cynaroides TaxID=273540 RepID=A0A9Q0QS29_9MAGN|nr:hypothetical protein NE237_002894 [Protea cynaroides]